LRNLTAAKGDMSVCPPCLAWK